MSLVLVTSYIPRLHGIGSSYESTPHLYSASLVAAAVVAQGMDPVRVSVLILVSLHEHNALDLILESVHPQVVSVSRTRIQVSLFFITGYSD